MDTKDIIALRSKLGLTQKELAGRLKVDVITISRWERGEQKPSLESIKRLNRLVNRVVSKTLSV